MNRFKASEVHERLADHHADLIIVDLKVLEADEIQILTSVRAQHAETPLIVLTEEVGADQMRRLLKFNIHDWLKKPVDGEELKRTIQTAVRSSKINNNRVHAVISAVGGAGATTTAIAMADMALNSVMRKKKPSIAVFDLDFSTGNCGLVLNMVNEFQLGSVASSPRRVDSEFVRAIQKRHERGFYVYSFKHPELNTELNGYELVLRMLDAVNMEHDHTFLDIPYYETEWKDDVLTGVNTCTVVTELNLPAIKHTIDVVDRVKKLRGEDFPVRVIINKRVSSLFGQRIGANKLRELFGDTEFSYLPYDADVVGEALDRGLLLSEVKKRNAIDKKLSKYLQSIELTEEAAA
ncbi:MAG: response regulator [Litoreibacter sp.]|nr:response regulator [Litoreibacter sp.]